MSSSMRSLIAEAKGAGLVTSVMKEVMRKHFSEYNLPVPSVKLVNLAKARYLARCKWIRGSSNTTMEVQRSTLADPKTLRRVMAHELIHHWDFLTRDHSTGSPKSDAHGAHFLQQAARINSTEGPDYVTVKSDQSYDVSRVPPYYILLYPISGGRYGWGVALRPSKRQKAWIVKMRAEKQARLFRITDGRFFSGAEPIGGRGYSYSPDKELVKFVTDLYHNGKTIELKP